jgi:DNA-binding CsgD family transcriptional regulator
MTPLLARAEGAALVGACQFAAYAFAWTGRVGTAIELSERGLATHLAVERSTVSWGPHIHFPPRCFALGYAGRLHDAEDVATVEYERAVGAGDVGAQRNLGWVLAATLVVRGRVKSAARLARESANLFGKGWPAMVRMVSIHLVHALALAGVTDEARAALAELDGLGVAPTDCFGAELLRGRAWTEVADGDLSAGLRWLQEAATFARGNCDHVFESAALHDLARLGHAKEVVVRLGELAQVIEGDLAPTRAAHAAGLVAGDAAQLEEVSASFEGMGADLLAAEAAADAAVAWRKDGDPRRAAAAERRARGLAARCEGARTPALTAVSARAALSARELEIARLAAAGVANKEIAARLYLSVRTVENKLHASYEKLGVDRRAELAEALAGY